MTKTSIDGTELKDLLLGGVAGVSDNLVLINELNVFPVPDGDTGTNMHHTLRRAYHEIKPLDKNDASFIAQRFAHGALMGARGNSGTILSQWLQGFADGLDNSHTITASIGLTALKAAVDRAYASVSQPVEGTMLTVARQATVHLSRDCGDETTLEQMLDLIIAGANRSLEETPSLLPILREAGVVDAGGMGLLCFLRGMRHASCGSGQVALATDALETARSEVRAGARGDYGYDVQFLMLGADLAVADVRRAMEGLGESVLVVGNAAAIKVHVHVDNPAVPIDFAIRTGAALDDVVVENMGLQATAHLRESRIGAAAASPDGRADIAVIAVAKGVGMQALFRDLNCSAVIDGGAGDSPAAEDFLDVMRQLPATRFIVLPNDGNIEMAARQAAALMTNKSAHVLPTHTVQQGISAMVAFGDANDCRVDLDEATASMGEACARVRSINLTRATRSRTINGLSIAVGDCIAIIDGDLTAAAADLHSVAVDAMKQATDDSSEMVTVYYGADVSESAAADLIERLSKDFDALEYELVFGGQDLYPYLISVE